MLDSNLIARVRRSSVATTLNVSPIATQADLENIIVFFSWF